MAGQIDSIWVDAAGAVHMIDWKRVRVHLDVAEGASWKRWGRGPLDFMLDNRFNHSVAQQLLGRECILSFASAAVDARILQNGVPMCGMFDACAPSH